MVRKPTRKSALLGELQEEFTAEQVSQAQVDLLKQPWRRIYTTNYDNVAEMGAAKTGKRLTPVTLSDAMRDSDMYGNALRAFQWLY